MSEKEFFTLIDTPGFGEDLLRDQVLKNEIKLAHSTILTLDATQLVSLKESELIEEMGGKICGLIIVINKVDLVPQERWEDLINYVFEKFKECNIDKRQIVLLSAKKALEDKGLHSENSKWLDLLDDFEIRLRKVIFRDSVGIKIANIQETCKNICNEIILKINEQDNNFTISHNEMLNKHKELENEKLMAEKSVERVFNRLLLVGQDISNTFESLFIEDWHKVVIQLRDKQTNWTNNENPILSPTSFAINIAEQAKNSLIYLVKKWIEEKVEPTLKAKQTKLEQALRSDFNDITDYLVNVSKEGLDKEIFLKQIFSNFPGEISHGDIENNVFCDTVISGIISAIIGYVIADIILYYILGLISGFLNPVLLAAAVVIGLFGFLIFGPEFVSNSLRNKIAENIINKLLEDDTTRKIRFEIKQKIEERFIYFSNEFRKNTGKLLQKADLNFNESLNQVYNSQKKQNKFMKDAEEAKLLLKDLEKKVLALSK
ncbi:MAG TPA: hypothetical protein PL110_10115 [Candidatus Eremiobacteraeota bacterium]|nr:MAG: GTPase Era [bacterium ADurb.Bin363]HPZ08459.1 hypothetical protein [Candidatus Eremiobacteraeota bacterium]